MQEREAINEILINVNEVPLDEEDIIEDINIAIVINNFLTVARKSALIEGWYFNELTLTLVPNTSNYIVIPKSYLSVDGSNDSDTYTVRDWKLFDKSSISFQFEEAVECDIVEDIVFDDIPFSVANYIVKTATLMAYSNIIGDEGGIRVRQGAMEMARIEAIRDNANKIDGNLLSEVYATNLLDRTGI